MGKRHRERKTANFGMPSSQPPQRPEKAEFLWAKERKSASMLISEVPNQG